MSEAELLELSQRAQFQRETYVKPNMAALYFHRFRITVSGSKLVSINRVGKVFFSHWRQDDLYNHPPEIECTNDEWAKELLIKLRVAQVLDSLADV